MWKVWKPWRLFSILKKRVSKNYKLPRDYSLAVIRKINEYKYKDYSINLETYLNNFSKSGQISELNNYYVCLVYGRGCGYFNNVYLDTEFGFVLVQKTLPTQTKRSAIACLGFDASSGIPVTVKQIQGVKSRQSDLVCLKWERMLLKICIDWAKDNGFVGVCVIRSVDSKWYNEQRSNNMFMKYDVTARRSGFKFDSKSKKYVLRLC